MATRILKQFLSVGFCVLLSILTENRVVRCDEIPKEMQIKVLTDEPLRLVRCVSGNFDRLVIPSKASSETQTVELSGFWIQDSEMPVSIVRQWAYEMENTQNNHGKLVINDQAKVNYNTLKFSGIFYSPITDAGYPCVNLSFWGMKRFCHWLSIKTGVFFRLPTEAEWEYSCRASSKKFYPWGSDENEYKSYSWTYKHYEQLSDLKLFKAGVPVMPVRLLKPNKWGIYDMIGNVEEVVADGFADKFPDNKNHHIKDPIVWPILNCLESKKHSIPFVSKVVYDKYAANNNWDVSSAGPILRGGALDYANDMSEYYSSARKSLNNKLKNDTELDSESPVYMRESLTHFGFRIVTPEELPHPTIQLWHWGLYKEYDPKTDKVIMPK